MTRIRDGIRLKTTPENVWPFIIDSGKLVQWRTDIRRIEIPDGEPLAVGTKYSLEKEVGLKYHRFDCTVTELEENQRFGFEGKSPGAARIRALYEIIPKDNKRCTVIVSEKVDLLDMNLFKKFFIDNLFLRTVLSNMLSQFLSRLRDMVENQEGQPRVKMW